MSNPYNRDDLHDENGDLHGNLFQVWTMMIWIMKSDENE